MHSTNFDQLHFIFIDLNSKYFVIFFMTLISGLLRSVWLNLQVFIHFVFISLLLISVLTIISSIPDLLSGSFYFFSNNACLWLAHSLCFCLKNDSLAGYRIWSWLLIFLSTWKTLLHCFPSSVIANRITAITYSISPCRTGCCLSDRFNISLHVL